MMSKSFSIFSITLSLVLPFHFLRAAEPPNILFLLADDLAQNSLGCYGGTAVFTPNLDKLADRGVVFKNAFVTTSVCAPSRACILTGLDQRHTGVRDFDTPLSPGQLAKTYPVMLRRAGYFTGFIGKWGIGTTDKDQPIPSSVTGQFDFWRGEPEQSQYFHTVEGKRLHQSTDIIPAAVGDFLKACPKEKPFCLSISFKAPHGPFEEYPPETRALVDESKISLPENCNGDAFRVLPDYLKDSLLVRAGKNEETWMFDRSKNELKMHLANYYRQVAGLDLAVGKIQALLEESGVARSTVIFFFSDNGQMLFERGLFGKWIFREGSIRVPLLYNDPREGKKEGGKSVEEMVLSIDMAPTILELAGLPKDEQMDGRSFLPLLKSGSSPWRSDWLYEHTFTLAAPNNIPRTLGIRTPDWKYAEISTEGSKGGYSVTELFDLRNDPGEERNLADNPAFKPTLLALRDRLQNFQREANLRFGQEPNRTAYVPLWEDVVEFEAAPHGEGNAYAPEVLRIGGEYFLWYGAQGRDGHDRIALATSKDGRSWKREGVVIDVNNENHVNDPSVVRVGDQYYMFYTSAGESIRDEIHLAVSGDGRHWQKKGAVLPRGKGGEWDSISAGRPAVLHEDGLFKMWYDGRRDFPPGLPVDGVPIAPDSQRHIGYATSPDGVAWTKHPDNPVFHKDAGGIDVKNWNGRYVLLFESGQGIRMATSRDGLAWSGGDVWIPSSKQEGDPDGIVTPFLWLDGESPAKVLVGLIRRNRTDFNRPAVRSLSEKEISAALPR